MIPYHVMYCVVLQLFLSLSATMNVQFIIPWTILSGVIFQSVCKAPGRVTGALVMNNEL